MSPPSVPSDSVCTPLLTDFDLVITTAETLERDLESLPDGEEKTQRLQTAQQTVADAANKLNALTHTTSLSTAHCLTSADQRLQELKARLFAQSKDWAAANELFKNIAWPFLSPASYFYAGYTVYMVDLVDNEGLEGARLLHQQASRAIDHAEAMTNSVAARSWNFYASALKTIVHAEWKDAHPDEEPSEASTTDSSPEIVMALERAVDLDPTNLHALLDLAEQYDALGEWPAAQELLERAPVAPNAPHDAYLYDIVRLWSLRMKQRGRNEGWSGEFDELQQAIAAHPEIILFHSQRIESLLAQGHPDAAIQALVDSLQTLPTDRHAIFTDLIFDSLFGSTPSALRHELLTALQSALVVAPQEPVLRLFRARFERQDAKSVKDYRASFERLEKWNQNTLLTDPKLYAAINTERILQRIALAQALDAATDAAGSRSATLSLYTEATQLAGDANQIIESAIDDGMFIAGLAQAWYHVGRHTGDAAAFEKAAALWKHYESTIVIIEDPAKIENTLSTLIQSAECHANANRIETAIAELISCGPEAEAEQLEQIHVMVVTLEQQFKTQVAAEQYGDTVRLYALVARQLQSHPLLRDDYHRLQHSFFDINVAGRPFELAAAREMCGTNPDDPALVLLLAYAQSEHWDDRTAVQSTAALLEKAASTGNLAPALAGECDTLRLAYHIAQVQHGARMSPATTARMNQIVAALTAAGTQDPQALALAAHYFVVTQQSEQALATAERLLAVPQEALAKSPALAWLPPARAWHSLVELYVARQNFPHAAHTYAIGQRMSPEHVQPDLQAHFFHTVAMHPKFLPEDIDAATLQIVTEMAATVGTTDPVMSYLLVKVERRYLMAQNDPWTMTTLNRLSENQAQFDRACAASADQIPKTLQPYLGLERVWQAFYRGKAVWQTLLIREDTVPLFLEANVLADRLIAAYPHILDFSFPKAWNLYWLGKITGEMKYYEAAIQVIEQLEKSSKGMQFLASQPLPKQHEFLRNKAWCLFKRMVPILRTEANYTEAAKRIRTELLPLIPQLAKLPSGSREATRDELAFQYSTYSYYADALDHERLKDLAVRPLKEKAPKSDASDADRKLANSFREKALAVLDQLDKLGNPPAETARARACTLLRIGIDRAQEASAITEPLLIAASGNTQFKKNLKTARECHVQALRLECRLPGLSPEKKLANLVWIIKFGYAEMQDDPQSDLLRAQYTLYESELREQLDQYPASMRSAFYTLLEKNPALDEARKEVMQIFQQRGLPNHLLDKNVVLAPPALPN